MTDLNRSIPPSLSDEEVMALYAERRLAGMKGSDAWFYRRYRRLSPRTRMFVTRLSVSGLAWLAGIGVYDIVTRHNQTGAFPLVGFLIGTAIGAIAVDTIPFPYR